MAKEKTEPTPESVRQYKTFFTLIFPSLLIALIPGTINGSIWYPLALKVLVFVWQAVTLKNFIDSMV